MMYVNRKAEGCTELRVHGVSGTPPESMLEHPHVCRVAGDDVAAFYRRAWEQPPGGTDDQGRRLEAYSWSGLTSGDWKRALWLLLLPFMLMNVAFHMTPRPMKDESRAWRAVRRINEMAQRLIALSLTITMMIAIIAATMDIVAWQCGRSKACAGGSALAFLQWSWLADPGTRLVVTALVPIAVVVLLWWLANRSWRLAEKVPPPDPGAGGPQVPLGHPDMWKGAMPVARLRALHIAAALAIIGVFVTAPFLDDPPDGPLVLFQADEWAGAGWLVATLLSAFLLVLVLCALALLQPKLSQRGTVGQPAMPGVVPGWFRRLVHQVSREDGGWQRWLALATVALLAGALAHAWFAPVDSTANEETTNLPWLSGSSVLVFVAQLVLVVVVFALCWSQAASARRAGRAAARTADRAPVEEAGTPVAAPPAWFGMAQFVTVAAAWVLGGGLAAALVLRVADVLGQPISTGSEREIKGTAVAVPVQYFWVAAAAFWVAVAAVVAAVSIMRMRSSARASYRRDLEQAYPSAGLGGASDEDVRNRADQIARSWARASISDVARRWVGGFAIVTAVILLLGVVGYVVRPDWLFGRWQEWMVTVGSLVMAAAVLGLMFVGRKAYSSPQFRRSVGILWDIGTFWPRATHPLAPPCYAERTVPDLVRRIGYFAAHQGEVVLSCHSQGSVIGAATVLQLPPEQRGICFLTYGNPLRRIYSRFFPVYFGQDTLDAVGSQLCGRPGPADLPDRERRTVWPWLNLYRLSDPIGGAVFFRYPGREHLTGDLRYTNEDVDWELVDPDFDRQEGDACYPTARGHSDYFADRAYLVAVEEVKRRRAAANASPPTG